MAKDLGAAPVTTAGADVYPMLERGAIDATEWGTLYENISMGFHKIAKYIIYPGVHQPTAPFELVINKEAWAKVNEADKQADRNRRSPGHHRFLVEGGSGRREGAGLLQEGREHDH